MLPHSLSHSIYCLDCFFIDFISFLLAPLSSPWSFLIPRDSVSLAISLYKPNKFYCGPVQFKRFSSSTSYTKLSIKGFHPYSKVYFTFNPVQEHFINDWNTIIKPLMTDNTLYSFLFTVISDTDDKTQYHVLSKALRISTLSDPQEVFAHISQGYNVLFNHYHIPYTYHMLIHYKIWLPDISPEQQVKADLHLSNLLKKSSNTKSLSLFNLNNYPLIPFNLDYYNSFIPLFNNEYLTISPLSYNSFFIINRRSVPLVRIYIILVISYSLSTFSFLLILLFFSYIFLRG
jgi:hypothetical protein